MSRSVATTEHSGQIFPLEREKDQDIGKYALLMWVEPTRNKKGEKWT
jgi:hypothetical protein